MESGGVICAGCGMECGTLCDVDSVGCDTA